jgi:hypothetical protein
MSIDVLKNARLHTFLRNIKKTLPAILPLASDHRPNGALRPTVESTPMVHTPETQPFVLEVPILEDETVDALHAFLLGC